MYKKTVVYISALLVVFVGGLAASETSGEVILMTALQPPTTFGQTIIQSVTPDAESIEQAPGLSQAVTFPRPLPGIKVSRDVGKALFDVNLVAMLGLNIADYLSTREALKYPGLEETNPLMKPFVKSPTAFAAIKIGTTALTYWSFKKIFKRNRAAGWILSTASNLLLSYVVANNLQQIQRAKLLR